MFLLYMLLHLYKENISLLYMYIHVYVCVLYCMFHRAGYDTRVYVEGLHVSGSVQAVVNLDYAAPFPHVASITATFVRK